MNEREESDLKKILEQNHPIIDSPEHIPVVQLKPFELIEIRLFISSTFADTQAERDVLIKRVVPSVNREVEKDGITIVPIDLRVGVLPEESKNCHTIQRTCLNEVYNCRENKKSYPFFLGLRTERYGWVQDDYMPAEKYEHPEHFTWVQTLKTYGKKISITSLECLHAALPMSAMRLYPVMLMYKRNITNDEKIPMDRRWIFEFDHKSEEESVDPDLRKQYNVWPTEEVEVFKDDKMKLDAWLEYLPHVRYSKYNCSYKDSRITGQNSRTGKKFGVGYVEDLEDFEEMVTSDLMKAIRENFRAADVSSMLQDERDNRLYEKSMSDKASTFVGRSELSARILEHCKAENVENSLMVVAGIPGQGKSALLSYVAEKCLNELRSEKNFVFLHGVDTCPGSNDLEQMLFRLHRNLSKFVGDDSDVQTAADLRRDHISKLTSLAKKHPDKRFTIIIDAVNQFHSNMQAWQMWWVPGERDNAPENLRFIISTLIKENDTYDNALKRCPSAVKVMVPEMSQADREEMVTIKLGKFNKKLATDGFLRNQMDILLSKNTTPLYLSAACESLRTEGIFEEMTKYIIFLPSTVPTLFQFLLDNWCNYYGDEFIRLLVCMITVTKDGLLENVIASIFAFIEEDRGVDFDCSFSAVFTAIRGFLSSGGGGYLHFFHDQINKVVRQKYLAPHLRFECQLHGILARYYLREIFPNLRSHYIAGAATNHIRDCLHKVVYHQVEAARIEQEPADFRDTLRNIFYVRERIALGQPDRLQQEYIHALEYAADETLIKVLCDWRKFASLYYDYLHEYPQWSWNCAMNQVQSSFVYIDTSLLNLQSSQDLPVFLANKPFAERDDIVVKYSTFCEDVIAISNSCDKLAYSAFCIENEEESSLASNVIVYDLKSGELLHQVRVKAGGYSLCFSSDDQSLWAGDCNGSVHEIDLHTDSEIWSCEEKLGGKLPKREWEDEESFAVVSWLQPVGLNTACGMEDGVITLISTATKEIVRQWETCLEPPEMPCECDGARCKCYAVYAYGGEQFVTGHKNGIKFWNELGQLTRSIDLKGHVYGVAPPQPGSEVIAAITSDQEIFIVGLSTGKTIIPDGLKTNELCSDIMIAHNGHSIICVDEDQSTILIIDSLSSTVKDRIPCPAGQILGIYNVNDDLMVVANESHSYLLNMPSPDVKTEDRDVKSRCILSCVLLNGSLMVLNNPKKKSDVFLEELDLDTFDVVQSLPLRGDFWSSRMVPHPNIEMLVVVAVRDILCVNVQPFEIVARHSISQYFVINEENKEHNIADVSVSGDGAKCMVTTFSGIVVLDIASVTDIKLINLFKYDTECHILADFHPDSRRIVVALRDEGVYIRDINDHQEIKKLNLKSDETGFVRFLTPETLLRILNYEDSNENGKMEIINLDGELIMSFEGKHGSNGQGPRIDKNMGLIITDACYSGGVNISDLETGKLLHKFYHHNAGWFMGFAYHAETQSLFCGNANGKVYVLRNTPN